VAKAGRPSTYSEKTADEIVQRMIEGESLTAICKDEKMPPRVTVYAWFDKHPDFYARCARAREALADYLVDEIDELAKTATKDNIEQVKIQVSTKQWRAMKMAPRMYGDRSRTEVTGANGGPIQTQATVVDATQLEPAQREALKLALLAAKEKKG
jgi:hypothetical protein